MYLRNRGGDDISPLTTRFTQTAKEVTSVLLNGASGAYDIVRNPLSTTPEARLYLAREEQSDTWRLVQVAASRAHNGALERAAFILSRLNETAEQFDAVYTKSHDGHRLHYDRLYPRVVETGISPEQGSRRINIYALADIDDIRRVVSLAGLVRRQQLRVDVETSAWIMGRLLKMLAFVHGEGIENRYLTANNILLDPQEHFAVTLDWSNSFVHPAQVPADIATTDIGKAAHATLFALGGTDDGAWPYEGHTPYITLLRQMMAGKYTDADKASDVFYELVRAEYGKSFHPFTTLPL